MDTIPRSTAQPGSHKTLWAGVAIVVIVVLAMGAALIRTQAQPQEPRLAVLPAAPEPTASASETGASAATEAVPSAAPLPPASTATDKLTDTNRPRVVHPRTSEPAVARAPERLTPKPDAANGDTLPDVKR